MPTTAVTALAFMIAGLLAVVVLVGLAQRILDATGVALALIGVLGGVMGGMALHSRSGGGTDG